LSDPYDQLMISIAGELAISSQPGKAMKTWREKAGIGQAELAREMKISPSVLSDYENGRRLSPGAGFLRRFVFALVKLDRKEGRLLRLKPEPSREGAILSIGEYTDPVPIRRVIQALECTVLTGEEQLERSLFGFTVLDSLRTIYTLSGSQFYAIYGTSTERVVVFTKVGLGRSPMVAVRVSPLKPRMVVIHGLNNLDQLAVDLALRERIVLATTTSFTESELGERLRSLATTIDSLTVDRHK
jgi:putative transcriptional regulator